MCSKNVWTRWSPLAIAAYLHAVTRGARMSSTLSCIPITRLNEPRELLKKNNTNRAPLLCRDIFPNEWSRFVYSNVKWDFVPCAQQRYPWNRICFVAVVILLLSTVCWSDFDCSYSEILANEVSEKTVGNIVFQQKISNFMLIPHEKYNWV